MKVFWSTAALGDLDRFAQFLHDHHPGLARSVAQTLLDQARILADHPQAGRPLEGHAEFRQLILHALRAPYVVQYRIDGDRVLILRVFHGRETRR